MKCSRFYSNTWFWGFSEIEQPPLILLRVSSNLSFGSQFEFSTLLKRNNWWSSKLVNELILICSLQYEKKLLLNMSKTLRSNAFVVRSSDYCLSFIWILAANFWKCIEFTKFLMNTIYHCCPQKFFSWFLNAFYKATVSLAFCNSSNIRNLILALNKE